MEKTAQTVSLEAFIQHPDTYFSRAVSGDLVVIVHEDQESYLIGADLFRFITECLRRYEISVNGSH